MAAAGFSYAQAARGASATPSSKVTSGAATPATGALSEATGSSNWADDVETDIGGRLPESQKASELSKPLDSKVPAVERTKMGDKTQSTGSSVSSPEMAPSASSISNEESSTLAVNGTASDSTWESKSSASATEPSWIAAREKRQNEEKENETAKDPGKKKKKGDKVEEPLPKPVVLTEAAPPTVNPWTKRLEQRPIVPPTPRPAPPTDAPISTDLKDGHQSRAESHKKAYSFAGTQGIKDVTNTANANGTGKRANDVRPSKPESRATPGSEHVSATTSSSTATRSTQSERKSLPNLNIRPPPSVKDEISWPTPETAQEQERKAAAEKQVDEHKEDDIATTSKARKKQDWKPMAVVPNIIWEASNVRPRGGARGLSSSDRGGRGGSLVRGGRGGPRGGSSGVGAGDRASRTAPNDDMNGGSRGSHEVPPPLPKPERASSTNSYQRPERGSRVQNFDESFTKSDLDSGSALGNGVRSHSPTQADSLLAKKTSVHPSHEDIPIPEPIPAQKIANAQPQLNGTPAEFLPHESSAAKPPSFDGRKERSFDGTKDSSTWQGPTRGNRRGGRGRGGGTRDLVNGNHHVHGSAHADFNSAFAVPPSPSAYGPLRGSNQHMFNGQAGRPGWRGASRSQSIPIDNFYNRYSGMYPTVNSYMPMYDYGVYPMSAMPFTGLVDHGYIMEIVRTQLEYYFSVDNLLKDMYLRKNMDSQGFVFLDLIANFNRIKQLTQDLELIKSVCIHSESIEIRIGEDGRDRLRKRDDWQQFVLAMGEREASAQTDGPQHLQRPERPQVQTFVPPNMNMRGPASAGLPSMHQRNERRSYDSSLPTMNGLISYPGPFTPIPEAGYGDIMNGEEMRGRSVKSPVHEKSISPSHTSPPVDTDLEGEADAFPDVHIEHLTVVVRSESADKPRMPYHSLASRTFSNGSIDTRSVFGDGEKNIEAATNGEPVANGTEPTSTSPTLVRSPNTEATNSDISLFWVKDKEMPVDKLPTDVQPEPYLQLRMKATDQRNHAATGNCPYDMDVLYQFWSHFLIRNFNNRMYTEFKQLALEDAKTRHNSTGVTNLIKYYSEALLNPKTIRDRVLSDYVQLVKDEGRGQNGAAFKQLRAAWRNGALNLKNRKKLTDMVGDDLRKQLDEA